MSGDRLDAFNPLDQSGSRGVAGSLDTSAARRGILVAVRANLAAGHRGERLPSVPGNAGIPDEPIAPEIDESLARQVEQADAASLWARFAARLQALGDTARATPAADLAARLEQVIGEHGLKTGVADADALDWLRRAGVARAESKRDGVSSMGATRGGVTKRGEAKSGEAARDGAGSKDAEQGAAKGSSYSLGSAALHAAGDRDDAFEVDFGVTLCDCAVAETGTLVLAAGSRRARLTSLAPPVHIALVPFSRLVPDLLDVGPAMPESPVDEEARSIVWITGSSRTADIESILIRGVHGPGHVIALGIVDA